MATKPRKILIAVPTMGGTMKTATAQSLVDASLFLTGQGHEVRCWTIDGCDIVFARNTFAAQALADQCDTLFFVDSDMSFGIETVRAMLAFDKPVVGAVCTSREIDLDRVMDNYRASGDKRAAVAKAMRYNIVFQQDQPQIKGVGRFVQVLGIGMAVTLIDTGVFRRLIEAGKVKERQQTFLGKPQTVWGFFDHLYRGSEIIAEDISFCYRWCKDGGGEVWGYVSDAVHHIGNFAYAGDYLLALKDTPPPPP